MADIKSQEAACIYMASQIDNLGGDTGTTVPPEITVISLDTDETLLHGTMTDRREIRIINDSSRFIYVGFSDPFDVDDAVTLFSGRILTIKFAPSEDYPIYAKLTEGATTIKIVEVK